MLQHFIFLHLHGAPWPVAAQLKTRVLNHGFTISDTTRGFVIFTTTLGTQLVPTQTLGHLAVAGLTDLVAVDTAEDLTSRQGQTDWTL